MDPTGTPTHLREGVRSAITSALDRDVELRGGRTARLLVAAGALGVLGAIGMIRMLAAHPYDHHPASHAALFSAIWSGLLIVTLAFALLRVRTPSLPLARAAWVGVLGLGIAGVCSALCPDEHFLAWWVSTSAGAGIRDVGGLPLSAFCFGGASTLVFATFASAVALGGRVPGSIWPLLPAGMLLLLLAPGVALQSVGSEPAVFGAWLLGTAGGAYGGVRFGIATRGILAPNR